MKRTDDVRPLGEIRAEPVREFTAAQIIHGILDASRNGMADIATHLIRLLAVWYPEDYARLDLAVRVAAIIPREEDQ